MEDTTIEDTIITSSSTNDPSISSPKSKTRPSLKDPDSPETATTAKSYDGVYYGDSEDELENLKIGTKEQPIIVESLEDFNYYDSFSHASELYGGDIININKSNEHDGVYYGDSDEDDDDDDSKVSRNRMAVPLHKMVIEEENVEENEIPATENEHEQQIQYSISNTTDETEAVETSTDHYCLVASVLSVVICNGCLDEVQLSSSIDAVLHEENPAESPSTPTPTHHPTGERRESEDDFPILDLPSSVVSGSITNAAISPISAMEDPNQTSRVGAKWKKRVTTLKQKRKEQHEEQQQEENQQPENISNNSSIPNDILALEETVSLEFDKLYTSWQQEKTLALDANSSSEGEELAGDNDGNSSSEGDDMHTCCDEDDENQTATSSAIPEDSENIVETPTQVRTLCVGTASSSVASGNSKSNEDSEVDEDEDMQSCATSTTPEDEENIVTASSSVASGHSKSNEDCVVDEDADMHSCATSTTPEDEENIATASSSVASGNSKSDEDCVDDEDEDMHSCNSQEATEESDAKPQNEATSMDDMYTCNSGRPGKLRVGEALSAPVGDEYELYSIDHDIFANVKEQQPEKDDENLVESTTTGCNVGFAFEDVSSLFSVIAKREEQEQDLSSLTFTERNDSKKYVQLNIIEGDRVGEVHWEEDVDIDIDNCSDTSYITAADEEELHEETKDSLPRESRSVKSENGNTFQVLGQTKATADLLEYFRTNYESTETALADTTDTVKGRMLGFLKNGNTSTPLTSALAKDVLEEAQQDLLLEQKEQREEELGESPAENVEDPTKNTTAPDKGLKDDASSGTLATEIHETVCIETIIQDSTDSLYSASPEDVQSSLQSQVEVVVYGHDSFVKQDDKAAATANQVWCCDWFGGAFNTYGGKTAKGTNEACLASLDSTEVSSHASWLDGKLKKKSQQEPPPQPWYVMPRVDSCTELEDLLLREEIASSPSHECGVDRLAILQEFHQFQSERQGSKQQREAATASSNNNRVMEIVLFPEERAAAVAAQ